jgi:hypothetical protein
MERLTNLPFILLPLLLLAAALPLCADAMEFQPADKNLDLERNLERKALSDFFDLLAKQVRIPAHRDRPFRRIVTGDSTAS